MCLARSRPEGGAQSRDRCNAAAPCRPPRALVSPGALRAERRWAEQRQRVLTSVPLQLGIAIRPAPHHDRTHGKPHRHAQPLLCLECPGPPTYLCASARRTCALLFESGEEKKLPTLNIARIQVRKRGDKRAAAGEEEGPRTQQVKRHTYSSAGGGGEPECGGEAGGRLATCLPWRR